MQTMTLNIVYQGDAIRMLGTAQSPQWVAADVCRVLGVANPRQVLSRFEDDEKGVTISDTLGGPQAVSTVTEPGLYRLILRSRKPEAAAFRRWVCHEVLPTIRRYGRYPASRPTASRLIQSELGLFGPITVEMAPGKMPPLAADVCPRSDLIPLRAVPFIDWLPVRITAATVYRWHQYGLRGVHLDTVRIGGKLYTTEAVVLIFCSRCASPNPRSAAA